MAIALIVAAGRGERLAAGRPKALVELAGRPMVQWSIDVFASMDEIEQIVVALPAGIEQPAGVTSVEGGSSRSDSVRRALAAAGAGDPVLVHDAARPLLTAEIARTTIAALEQSDDAAAAIAAAPVTDTIKRVDELGGVHETLERGLLWAVQTPQVFRRDVLQRALDVSQEVLASATDDAWLIERLGERVVIADVKAENMKVTRPLDLEIAGRLLARRRTESA
jgi:2-C-methyl-D-erythritol 4-phosphate cytidylyltransferase